MINLLPPAFKTGYRYAQYNRTIRRWIVVLLFALVGVGALTTYGLVTIHQSISKYNGQVSTVQTQLQHQHLSQIESQVQSITGSLRLADTVLSTEVLFSKLITQIGSAMPDGTLLTGLNIDQTSGGLDLSAAATNYTSASQVQVNLADPAKAIFAKVDIVSITCSSQNAPDPTHPCVAELRALFNAHNQFLFINQGAKP
jgi:hypothetical protein